MLQSLHIFICMIMGERYSPPLNPKPWSGSGAPTPLPRPPLTTGPPRQINPIRRRAYGGGCVHVRGDEVMPEVWRRGGKGGLGRLSQRKHMSMTPRLSIELEPDTCNGSSHWWLQLHSSIAVGNCILVPGMGKCSIGMYMHMMFALIGPQRDT